MRVPIGGFRASKWRTMVGSEAGGANSYRLFEHGVIWQEATDLSQLYYINCSRVVNHKLLL